MGNTIIERGNSLLDASIDGINSITCLPTRSCLQGTKNINDSRNLQNDTNVQSDRIEHNLFEIIREQQDLLDTDEAIDPLKYESLLAKMAKFYGAHPDDIKFVEMEVTNLHKKHDSEEMTEYSNSREPQSKYKGFVIRGRKTGYGQLYYMNGDLQTKGTWYNDKLHGDNISSFYQYNNAKYKSFEGKMVEGLREGNGKEFYKNGKIMYDGGFNNDEWHGENVKIHHFDGELEYEGTIFKGMRQGFGRAYHDNGVLNYAGMWQDDKPIGNYIIIWDDKGEIRYEGPSEDMFLGDY